MNRNPLIASLSFCLLLSLFAACSKRDKVINVEENDAEMVAAIAKARDTLPHFWQVYEKPARGETNFALKVKITDKQGTEHFWATDVERRDGKIRGTINNDPNIVQSVKLGDRMEIPEADISDWLYMREGKMIGNQTVKPLFKQMPADEVKQLKAMMADP
jgi:uncharacterized protein YegJ (DUF2314 family)